MDIASHLKSRPFWIKVLLGWAAFLTAAVFFVTRQAPLPGRAIVGMGATLFVVWVLALGSVMYFCREPIRKAILRIPLPWWMKFVLFSIALAMLEEVITTSLTNLAPLYGAKVGEAYITASANYWDVILHHSVIVFVPGMIGWAWLLSRYKFDATEVFLIWGFFGYLAELGFSGPSQVMAFGFWIFIYGLMLYLPAYTLPELKTPRPRFYHYILALFTPYFSLMGLYVVFAVLSALFPNSYFGHFHSHPKIDFAN